MPKVPNGGPGATPAGSPLTVRPVANDVVLPSPRTGDSFARRRATAWLIGIFAASVALRIVLASEVPAPFIFLDDLGYSRLAQSIGDSGHLALFGKAGLSYPPLYPALLAPIYALHASGTTAFFWMKIVNCFVMSLAVFPIYGIARFVLPRRPALLVVGLSAAAPLMYYTTLVLSENLAYPLFLVAVWAMLRTVREPSVKWDAIMLVAIAAVTLTRVQMVALLPAALTAIVLAALLGVPAGRTLRERLLSHRLLNAATVAVVAAGTGVELAGKNVFAAAGRYANVGVVAVPGWWRVTRLVVEHLAELSVAVSFIPYAGTLIAAYLFFRYRSRGGAAVFASVALAVTFWLVAEVAYNDAAFYDFVDFQRIHERYLIYLIPFFLTAFVVAARLPAARRSLRLWGAASVAAAAAPALIPYNLVLNNTVVLESFGLTLFARVSHGDLVPVRHPLEAMLLVAAAFSAVGVVMRHKLPALVIATVACFLLFSLATRNRITSAAYGSSLILKHQDWVDRTDPEGDVVLLASPSLRREVGLQTMFFNLSVDRLAYVCTMFTEADFGERRVTLGHDGVILEDGHPLNATYAVVSRTLRLQGRVVARDRQAGVMLVATRDGRLQLAPGAYWPDC